MAQRSPVLRRQTRSRKDDSDSDSVDSQDRSYASSGSRQNDSHYSFTSLHERSRNESSTMDSDRTAHTSVLSDSPDKSFSPSPCRLYPNLSELNESGDSGSTRKRVKLYPKLDTLNTPETKGSTNNSSVFRILAIGLLLVLMVYAILYLNVSNTSAEAKTGYQFFESEIKSLKNSFPSQTNRFWATLSASALHVFEQQDPCYPSVILMATQNKHQKLNACLARQIASTFSASFGRKAQISTMMSDVEDFEHLSADEQKLHLDKSMQKAFQQEGGKAFVISNIQSLSPKAALLLHGFCDGDNAPFKDVMIILTFQVDDGIVFKSVKEVERFLTDIWSKDLDMDKLTALMSRVANNPVVLMAESNDIVENLCS